MVSRRRRGEGQKREPLTLEQFLVGGAVVIPNAAVKVHTLRVALAEGGATSDELASALKAFLLGRDCLDAIAPLVRRRLREIRHAEIEAKR